VIVVDPMLASGGSAVQAVSVVKAAGAKEIVFVCIVSSPEGVAAMQAAHPEVRSTPAPSTARSTRRNTFYRAWVISATGFTERDS